MKNKGFTMIELLIVIAVLGILAVAVLSAINPIEQINRSRDTGSRSDSEQLISAVDRFYASRGYYPWQSSPNDAANNISQTLQSINAGMGTNILANLSGATGELRDAFMNRIQSADYNTLYIYNQGLQGSSTYVCFEPQSASFGKDVDDRCIVGMPSDVNTANINTVICNSTVEDRLSCLP